jgi:hypothetical protein
MNQGKRSPEEIAKTVVKKAIETDQTIATDGSINNSKP